MPRKRFRRFLALIGALIAAALMLASCASAQMAAEEPSFTLDGVSGTMSVYNEDGGTVYQEHGVPVGFNAYASESLSESSFMLTIDDVDVVMSVFGVPLIFAEDGIVDALDQLPAEVQAKTIKVFGQDGKPLATFAGNSVKVVVDSAKSTVFTVDGKYLLVQQAEYILYNNDLIE